MRWGLCDEPAIRRQGDFTGDGRFDQTDIVAALQSGSYAHEQYNWWNGGSLMYGV